MLLSLSLLLCSYHLQLGFATSIADNGTSGDEIATLGWQSSPTTRGTFSILLSCLITLTLCVYTAIHPNVPRRGITYWEFLWTRVKWVLVGILAPELVVYAAWRQWTSARRLTKEMLKVKDEHSLRSVGIPTASFASCWSMMHSFFVEMGGYVIARKDDQNVTLTTKGVLCLVELGYELPRLTQADIQDRSKADPITKIITCIQAVYMIAEVIGRRAANLPITMLEINTMGHVVCALAMFTFWFQKPMNIELAVMVEEDWLTKQQQRITQHSQGFWSPAFWKRPREHQAKIHRSVGSLTEVVTIREDNLFLIFLERLKELKLLEHIEFSTSEDHLRAEIHFGPPALNKPWKTTDVILVVAGAHISDPEHAINDAYSIIQDTKLWPWLVTHIFQCEESLESLWPDHATTLCLGQALQLYLTIGDVIKWDHAWMSFVASGALQSSEAWSTWKREFDSQAQAEDFTTFQARNWPSGSGELQTKRKLLGISILSLATGFYGGLHLLLWSAYFPTTTERWLWRVCATIIAGSGVTAGYLVLIISDESDPLPRYLKPIMWPFQKFIVALSWLFGPEMLVKFSVQFTLIAAYIVGPFYIAARAYIVIESFISLRRLPVDAYKVPLWSEFWPHA